MIGKEKKIIWKMAWRNIWRNKRRSALTMAMIAFTTSILLVLIAMTESFNEQMVESSVTTFTGHIQINRKGFFGNESIDGYLEQPDLLISHVENMPHVKAVTTRIMSGGLVSYQDISVGCLLVGVKPKKESEVTIFHNGIYKKGTGKFLETERHFFIEEKYGAEFSNRKISNELLQKFVKEGKGLDSQTINVEVKKKGVWTISDGKNLYMAVHENKKIKVTHCRKQLIMGTSMARKLKVKLHDTVTIYAQSLASSLEAMELEIIGIFDVGNEDFNKHMAMLPHSTAAILLGFGPDKVSQIIVRLDYDQYLNEVKSAIEQKIVKDKLQSFYSQKIDIKGAAIFDLDAKQYREAFHSQKITESLREPFFENGYELSEDVEIKKIKEGQWALDSLIYEKKAGKTPILRVKTPYLVSEEDGRFYISKGLEEIFEGETAGEIEKKVEQEADLALEKNIEILGWDQILKHVVMFIKLEEGLTWTILTIVFIAVFIIIFNVVVMSVMERKREFGVMKAVGVKPGQLIQLVLLESVAMVTLAVAIGCAFGTFIALIFYFNPVELAIVSNVFKMGMLDPVVSAIINEKCFSWPISVVWLTAFLAPLWPARMLAKLQPVEAMRAY